MKFVEEKKFYNHMPKEHKKRMLKIKSGGSIESDNLKDALKNVRGISLGLNKKACTYKIIQGRDFLRDVKKILKSGDKSVLLDIQETIDELKNQSP